MNYEIGDQVEVYIPLGNDPDHRYHGETGEITNIFEDNLDEILETPGRGHIYTVKFDNPDIDTAEFRYTDLEKI